MIEKEVISRLNDLIDTCNQGIEMHPYDKELFETDKEALQTALQLLEQKDNKINKVIDKLKEDIKNNIKKAGSYIRDEATIEQERAIAKFEEANEILKILEE